MAPNLKADPIPDLSLIVVKATEAIKLPRQSVHQMQVKLRKIRESLENVEDIYDEWSERKRHGEQS